eukprot:m.66160 g.66160  ORF g.66160 m.66160 type:complete len:200 (+) comp13719_c0_seq2:330-929(+)
MLCSDNQSKPVIGVPTHARTRRALSHALVHAVAHDALVNDSHVPLSTPRPSRLKHLSFFFFLFSKICDNVFTSFPHQVVAMTDRTQWEDEAYTTARRTSTRPPMWGIEDGGDELTGTGFVSNKTNGFDVRADAAVQFVYDPEAAAVAIWVNGTYETEINNLPAVPLCPMFTIYNEGSTGLIEGSFEGDSLPQKSASKLT